MILYGHTRRVRSRIEAGQKRGDDPTDIQHMELKQPDLTGSFKQVQWARTIRRDALDALSKAVRSGTMTQSEVDARCREFSEYASASWWIDNRLTFQSS